MAFKHDGRPANWTMPHSIYTHKWYYCPTKAKLQFVVCPNGLEDWVSLAYSSMLSWVYCVALWQKTERLTLGADNPRTGWVAANIGRAGLNDVASASTLDVVGGGPWPSSAISDMYCSTHSFIHCRQAPLNTDISLQSGRFGVTSVAGFSGFGHVTSLGSLSMLSYSNLLLLLVWHAPLGLRSAKRRHQSPEWMILSHSYRLIQGEIVRPQVLLGSL